MVKKTFYKKFSKNGLVSEKNKKKISTPGGGGQDPIWNFPYFFFEPFPNANLIGQTGFHLKLRKFILTD